jgi:F-type H+-transporting ATPase subunit b
MSINASLIGQMITFMIFVWFCMKFIWPKLLGAIQARQKTIADGLAAGDRGLRELEAADLKVIQIIDEAKQQSAEILEVAQQRSHQLIEDAKLKARVEHDKIVDGAQDEIEQQTQAVRRELYEQVSTLVLVAAEKVIGRSINDSDNQRIIDDLIAEAK